MKSLDLFVGREELKVRHSLSFSTPNGFLKWTIPQLRIHYPNFRRPGPLTGSHLQRQRS